MKEDEEKYFLYIYGHKRKQTFFLTRTTNSDKFTREKEGLVTFPSYIIAKISGDAYERHFLGIKKIRVGAL